MELDERKEKILKAIIQTYLETGEPVGSRTISKYSDLQLSSATIRNEMSDLEELGYIIQPHTSAGRIPSDKGYRFYVDQLMKEKENEVTEMQELVIQRVDRVELLLKACQAFGRQHELCNNDKRSPVSSHETEIYPAFQGRGRETFNSDGSGGQYYQELNCPPGRRAE